MQKLLARGDRRLESRQIAGLQVWVWRPTLAPGTRAPLVIFSHGFHGSGLQSTFLMRALAENGYLAMAPDHKDAFSRCGQEGFRWRPPAKFARPDQWSDRTFQDRAQDIKSLVQALEADEEWSTLIDWSRFALVGHSLAGTQCWGWRVHGRAGSFQK